MQKKLWENVLVWIIALALVGSGCYYFYARDKKPDQYDLKPVAGVVDGMEVREADISYIADTMRTDYYGTKQDDETWAKTLLDGEYTPETLREYIFKHHFATQIMVINDAAALDIYPDADALDLRLEEQKEAFGTDAAWLNYLHYMGFADEIAYRRFLEAQEVITPLMQSMYGDIEATDEEINDYLSENAQYLSGRRSSAVIIDITEETPYDEAYAQAEAALAQLDRGVDFATVSSNFSASDKEIGEDGDMGWSSVSYVGSEYNMALDELSVGETSGIVESVDRLYIISCTDRFTYEEDSFDPAEMPESLKAEVLENLPNYLKDKRPKAYFEALLETDRFEIYEMPKGLPYDVDMSLADTDEGESGEEPDNTEPGELQIIDTVVGTGPEAHQGDLVRVTYVGTFEDGDVFDASYLHDGYYEFTLGVDSVIEGWHLGVEGMRVGGTRTLIIPPHLAYGERGQGSIPPNTTLIFEIELLSVNGDFGDSDGSGASDAGADSGDTDAGSGSNTSE